MSVTRDPDRNLLLQEEVHTLLQKGAVELVNPPPLTPGFYSRLFLVLRKNGKMIPVIDLSVLNQHLIVPHFKMETNRSIWGSIHLGMWTTSRFDRRLFPYSYFPQVPQVPEICLGRQGIRFQDDVFGLSTTPLVFTRIFQAVVAHLHSQSIFIHSYLDDSLLKNMSQFLLKDHTHFVIGLLLKLGFLIAWKKSELVPSQDIIFLGEHYRTDLGLVFPPEGKIVTLQFLVNKFFRQYQLVNFYS
jgi:hypothetical protein